MIIMQLGIAHITHVKESIILSVKERILALRLLEKQKKHPNHAKELGIEVKIKEKIKRSKQNGKVREV